MTQCCPPVAETINVTCLCQTLDRAALLGTSAGAPLGDVLVALPITHPHLFADSPVYVSRDDMDDMRETVSAIEALVMLPAYLQRIGVEPAARGPAGVFMGYDFHLSAEGPRLIEVNTNAGGAFLNAIGYAAQVVCCEGFANSDAVQTARAFEANIARMFVSEWHLAGRSGQPNLIAIVDTDPSTQYLYPEFLLAQALLRAQGMETLICDPSELRYSGGKLRHGDRVVDLIYNRLVDFDLSCDDHTALRSAYADNAVVVTPGPRHHKLLADKGNLAIWTDVSALEAMQVPDTIRRGLARVPLTRLVTPANATDLWENRRELFFKPLCGNGGKAVYRGDKLTKKVWADILGGSYVAQARIAPPTRAIRTDGVTSQLKFDVRLYTYRGEVLLAAARVYQGQVTNFRTPGGGHAPVIVV